MVLPDLSAVLVCHGKPLPGFAVMYYHALHICRLHYHLPGTVVPLTAMIGPGKPFAQQSRQLFDLPARPESYPHGKHAGILLITFEKLRQRLSRLYLYLLVRIYKAYPAALAAEARKTVVVGVGLRIPMAARPVYHRYLSRYLFAQPIHLFAHGLLAAVVVDIKVLYTLQYVPTKPLFEVLVFVARYKAQRAIIFELCLRGLS